MALYDFMCSECGTVSEMYFPIEDKPATVECGCGGAMTTAFLKAPSLHGELSDYARRRFPYYDESLDVTFSSLKEKQAYLKKNNLRIREPGEKIRGRKKDPIAEKLAQKVEILQADSQKELDKKMDDKLKKVIETRKA